ncbi:MAG: enoyl-CoA hydratase/carnithine racemase [Janthinobacterium sp.]|jgi:enoyl-CoA hydratase/carnithine racemase
MNQPDTTLEPAMANNAPVLLEERACANGMRIAIATLDAPKSLHALTLDMIRALDGALKRWALDPLIACVVLQSSTDKAFCAGGDVRSLRQAVQHDPDTVPNPAAQTFFKEEYRLDHRIHTYAKPLLVWGGGIVMGGGVGLMAGASHRVVTETTRIAMPEISIGLFPDVGGSWVLPRMPARTGLFIGLTGAPLNANDALFTGLADYFLPQQQRAAVLDALCTLEWQGASAGTGTDRANHIVLDVALRNRSAVASTAENVLESTATNVLPASEVRQHFDTIATLTASRDLTEVVAAITGYDGDSAWLRRAATTLASGSPSSAAVTWALHERARHLSLADVFRLEMIVAIRSCAQPDFTEGVRALLVDKDNAPRWQPATLAGADDRYVEKYFQAPWSQHPLADL